MKGYVKRLVQRLSMFSAREAMDELDRRGRGFSALASRLDALETAAAARFDALESTLAAVEKRVAALAATPEREKSAKKSPPDGAKSWTLPATAPGVIIVAPRHKPKDWRKALDREAKNSRRESLERAPATSPPPVGGNKSPMPYWNKGFFSASEDLFLQDDINVWRSVIADDADFRRREQIFDEISLANPDSLVIDFHGRGVRRNTIHCKVGYFSGMWFVDTGGFSQYHSLALTSRIPKEMLPPPSEKLRRIRQHVLESRTSKYPQVESPVDASEPYGFFALQLPNDQSLSGVGFEQYFGALEASYRYCLTGGRKLLIKEHPDTKDWGDKRNKSEYAKTYKKMMREFVAERPEAALVEGHIHDLAAGADIVFSNNSGVGFEALLLGKPVAAFVRVDYHHAALRGGALKRWDDGDVGNFDREYAERFLSLYFDLFSYLDMAPDNVRKLMTFHDAVLNDVYNANWPAFDTLEPHEAAVAERIANDLKRPDCPVPLFL